MPCIVLIWPPRLVVVLCPHLKGVLVLSIEVMEKTRQNPADQKEINFRPGPASYVYMTCVAQVSAVCRDLKDTPAS
jgi:hypothetical protein